MRSKNTNYKFRGARVASGHTQATLADKLGVSVPTIYNWEAGHSRPKPRDMIVLAKEMNVTVEDVVRMFA